MGKTFKGFLEVFDVLFAALKAFSGALLNLARWAEEVSLGFFQGGHNDRLKQQREFEAEMLQTKSIPAIEG